MTPTDNVIPFPSQPGNRLTYMVRLERLDGTPLATAIFARGAIGAAWRWIEDQVSELTGCATDAVQVADDDVLTVDGMPVARVVL